MTFIGSPIKTGTSMWTAEGLGNGFPQQPQIPPELSNLMGGGTQQPPPFTLPQGPPQPPPFTLPQGPPMENPPPFALPQGPPQPPQQEDPFREALQKAMMLARQNRMARRSALQQLRSVLPQQQQPDLTLPPELQALMNRRG